MPRSTCRAVHEHATAAVAGVPLGQLALSAAPAGELALLGVLERDRPGLKAAGVEIANATFAARQAWIWGESTTTVASDSSHFGAFDRNVFTEALADRFGRAAPARAQVSGFAKAPGAAASDPRFPVVLARNWHVRSFWHGTGTSGRLVGVGSACDRCSCPPPPLLCCLAGDAEPGGDVGPGVTRPSVARRRPGRWRGRGRPCPAPLPSPTRAWPARRPRRFFAGQARVYQRAS